MFSAAAMSCSSALLCNAKKETRFRIVGIGLLMQGLKEEIFFAHLLVIVLDLGEMTGALARLCVLPHATGKMLNLLCVLYRRGCVCIVLSGLYTSTAAACREMSEIPRQRRLQAAMGRNARVGTDRMPNANAST